VSAVTRLWAEYRQKGCESARARLIHGYLGLVYHAARELARWPGRGETFEDLVGAGTLGLVQALEGFDPFRGVAFSTYAMPRIRGAMVDEIHVSCWAPRTIRVRRRLIARVREELQQQSGGPPRSAEMAGALGVDLSTYWRWARDVDERPMLALDHRLRARSDDAHVKLADVIADPEAEPPDARRAREESLRVLRAELDALPDRDRRVLTLYYFEGLTLREIGDALGVTESRISQVHRRALGRLRRRLEDVEPR
jgi:RNA polymerase sigma factor for flagellar operon FliA